MDIKFNPREPGKVAEFWSGISDEDMPAVLIQMLRDLAEGDPKGEDWLKTLTISGVPLISAK